MSSTTSPSALVFDVAGMDCGDCARSVERVVGVLPGIDAAQVAFATGTLTVSTTSGDPDLVRSIDAAVERAGYSATLRTGAGPARIADTPWWQNRKLLLALPAAVTWAIAFWLSHWGGEERIGDTLFILTAVIAGIPVYRAAIAAMRARRLDMNGLMSISIIGAGLLGDWQEGALVVVLFTIGTTLQGMAFDHTRRAIRSLLDVSPDEATVVRDGVERTVRTSSLVPGDSVRVRPGNRVPTDGIVRFGSSAIDQAAITGESIPVMKGVGDDVYGGTVNGAGMIEFDVTKASSESTLSGIVRLVEEAQAQRAPTQALIDRFAAVYTPVVVAFAAIIGLAGWLVLGDAGTWAYRALVLACPCALVISTPVTIVTAIGAATRNGMLVKGGAALEAFGKVRAIAFDKTGTLTYGRPAVQEVIATGRATAADVLTLAAAVEQHSEHPLGRAIVARALHDDLRLPPTTAFISRTGRGVSATIDGRPVHVGSERLVRETNPEAMTGDIQAFVDRHAAAGRSVVFVMSDIDLAGAIAVSDRVRPDVAGVVRDLKADGITRIVMLTGDRTPVARAVGRELGIDDVRADLLPQDKLDALADLRRESGLVAMVGDGINDSPALAAADVGIAMGMAGTDVALESADLALMRDDLSALTRLHRLSRRTRTIILQNVGFSLATKALALVLGAFGIVSLWIAVLVDVGTSLVVVFNGLRLMRDIETRVAAPAAVNEVPACGCGGDHDHEGHAHAA
jgi:Cd2+/Zn2+-exporting ATPase